MYHEMGLFTLLFDEIRSTKVISPVNTLMEENLNYFYYLAMTLMNITDDYMIDTASKLELSNLL